MNWVQVFPRTLTNSQRGTFSFEHTLKTQLNHLTNAAASRRQGLDTTAANQNFPFSNRSLLEQSGGAIKHSAASAGLQPTKSAVRKALTLEHTHIWAGYFTWLFNGLLARSNPMKQKPKARAPLALHLFLPAKADPPRQTDLVNFSLGRETFFPTRPFH